MICCTTFQLVVLDMMGVLITSTFRVGRYEEEGRKKYIIELEHVDNGFESVLREY